MAALVMNESAAPRPAILLFLLASLFLAGCRDDAGAVPLAGATMGGPFTLTAQDGRRVSDRDTRQLSANTGPRHSTAPVIRATSVDSA